MPHTGIVGKARRSGYIVALFGYHSFCRRCRHFSSRCRRDQSMRRYLFSPHRRLPLCMYVFFRRSLCVAAANYGPTYYDPYVLTAEMTS